MTRKLWMVLLTVLLSAAGMQAQKVVGGDISLLPSYEANGAKYMDKDGKSITNVLSFLKEQGMNAMRVRLFVDPSNATSAEKGQGVRQDLAYVKALGKQIKDAGLQFMLDFHYSDTWADPGQQNTPASFKNSSSTVEEQVYNYTKQCLTELNEAGATPDYIQTGNEISFGMLWDSGCKVEANSSWNGYTDTNWANLTNVLKSAGQACREVCPQAKIILHTEQCANNSTLDVAFYKRIKSYEVDYDIIGVSYYPYYKGLLKNLNNGLTQLEKNFPEKEIMVVETGCGYKYQMGDQATGYELSYEGQRKFAADLVTMLNQHQQVKGLFWWFLEANEYGLDWSTKRVTDSWYNASLFDNSTGKALPALYELKNFVAGDTGVREVVKETQDDDAWYTLDGRRVARPAKGIYVHKGKKHRL